MAIVDKKKISTYVSGSLSGNEDKAKQIKDIIKVNTIRRIYKL